MSKINVKTTFEAARIVQPIYTGGSVALDKSGRFLATTVDEDALIVDLKTGGQLARLEGDGELITSLTITPSASHVVVSSRSLSMRFYALTYSEDPTPSIETELLRTLKPHTSPVVTTAIDHTGTLLATGSADGTIKIWDIRGGYVTHTFHGHGGVISALCFFEAAADDEETEDKTKSKKSKRKSRSDEDIDIDAASSTSGFRLASGSEDGKIRVWDLHKRKSVTSLESHVSVVRSLSYSAGENALLSASRDKTITLWDARTWKTRRIIPVLESIETAGFLSNGGLCYTGGENGRFRVWDTNRGGEVTEEQEAAAEHEAIVSIQVPSDGSFAMSVHADQTMRLYSLDELSEYQPGEKIEPLPVIRRLTGNDDEIIDLAYAGPDRSLVALATNSETIRIISTSTSASADETATTGQDYFGADVAYLEGHDEIIICLDVDWSGHWIVTGAKDNTARLWRIDPENSSYTCYAVFTGHAESLGAVALPRTPPPSTSPAYTDPLNHPPAFIFTGSQDRTIKRWDTSKLQASKSSNPLAPKAAYTRKAHDKDINALDVNHTSTLFASASQDRTVRIWSVEDGSTVGILRGHRRGVWSVRFAPKDTPIITSDAGTSTSRGLILTGSGDKTVKVWSLSDYTCLLTFEGHSNSVLKVLWLPASQSSTEEEETAVRGSSQQPKPLVASAAGDGLVKIWSPYTGELETTLDNHTDRVWALAVPYPSGSAETSTSTHIKTKQPPQYALISGSADSTATFWKDTTSSTLSEAVNANSARIEQDQELQNYIHAGAYREAITLALQLNHPGRLLSLFTSAFDEADEKRAKTAAGDATDLEEEESGLTGNSGIDTVLQTLDPDNLYLLLLRIRDWNTNARNSRVAQRILYTLAKSYPSSTFVELAGRRQPAAANASFKGGKRPSGLKDVLDALAAYTERHYRRVEELVDESYLVEWVLREMDGGMIGQGIDGNAVTESDIRIQPEHERDVIMLES